MIRFNDEKIEKMKNDIIYFKGYIPAILYFEILNVDEKIKRRNFIKSNGLSEEINNQDLLVKKKMRESDDPLLYNELILKEWIKNNPNFRELFIID